ncbi:hypothetical protein AVEN_192391-1 [Araneus ventricosus]|uniref:Uncharacterized protein n=1 Tax=Araneus ventricosus TaxID=182803 RepID=A0A4Y2H7H0_ARAVE|nr:hypothetical protein AVEN_192391-1 [Araneus ventricosus]
MATGSHSIKSSRAEPTERNAEGKTKLGSHPKPQRRSEKKNRGVKHTRNTLSRCSSCDLIQTATNIRTSALKIPLIYGSILVPSAGLGSARKVRNPTQTANESDVIRELFRLKTVFPLVDTSLDISTDDETCTNAPA